MDEMPDVTGGMPPEGGGETSAPAPVDTPVADPDRAADWDDRWTGEQGKKYLTRIRNETAQYRQRYEPYERTFGKLHDADATVLRNFADAVAAGDRNMLRAYSEQFYKAFVAEQEEAAENGEEVQPLTRQDFDRLWAEREQQRMAFEQQRETQREAQDIRHAATELGYDPGKDPLGYQQLLTHAKYLMEQEGGPDKAQEALKMAKKAIEGQRQRIVDEFLARKTADASRVPSPSGQGATPAKDTRSKSMDDAHAAARELFR